MLNVSPAVDLMFTPSASIIPTIYHAATRTQRVAAETVALRLSDLYSFKTGRVKFDSREDLCQAFRIRLDCEIVLTGVDHDRRIEPWWKLGNRRLATIKSLLGLGIDLVTTPNFSMILDRPRMDDLHAMKRIAIVHEEFCRMGLPAALHVNGRTDRDFERWAEFLIARPTIHQLAFEFSTGNGRADRLPLYIDWLCQIADAVDRPLDLLLRGNPRPIPMLRQKFHRVRYIETTSFMRTTKRRRAARIGNNRIVWLKYPTAKGEDLAALFDFNVEEQAAWLSSTYFRDAV